jgi:hypothetical protein
MIVGWKLFMGSNSWSAVASAGRHRSGFKQLDLSRIISTKAPSPPRSAGALQIVAAGKLIHQQQSRIEALPATTRFV